MKTDEVLKGLRDSYRDHLELCKVLTDNIANYMSDNGFGCTVFVNDNLQIEVVYNIPRGGPGPISTLRIGFYNLLKAYCKENELEWVYEESIVKKDYCLPKEYMTFYSERVVLDVE